MPSTTGKNRKRNTAELKTMAAVSFTRARAKVKSNPAEPIASAPPSL
jgi:hypothetical protein